MFPLELFIDVTLTEGTFLDTIAKFEIIKSIVDTNSYDFLLQCCS